MRKSNLGERVTTGTASKYVGRDVTLTYFQYYASSNSKGEHPPVNPLGTFEVVYSPARGKIFLQKYGPRDKKPTPGEYFRRSFLLIGVEIWRFCRNQTLKRIGRLSKYSSLIPSSFSLSTILKVFPQPLNIFYNQ